MHIQIPKSGKKRVVIVGAGFAGIKLTRLLLNQGFQVVLFDKNNYHTFQPLLYQVATAGLDYSSIAFPVRRIFKKKENFYFRMAEVISVNAETQVVDTTIGEIEYDHLVIASGSKTNFFNFNKYASDMMQLKTLTHALNLRSLILQNFENALMSDTVLEQDKNMNIVIIGGGPTGVELAGALGEMKKYILPNDYPELNVNRMQIYIIERSDRVLINMPETLSKKTYNYLNQLGVNVLLNTSVLSYENSVLSFDKGNPIYTGTCIWTAGVQGAPINGLPKESIVAGNRILVNEFNEVSGVKNVFAIGDVCCQQSETYPHGHPLVAPVAVQMADILAKNLVNQRNNKPLKAFHYFDKGSLATIGRNRAVASFGQWKFSGFIAWVLWLIVHLMTLVGFRNKLVVFTDWQYNYFTYDRALRLIISPCLKQECKHRHTGDIKLNV